MGEFGGANRWYMAGWWRGGRGGGVMPLLGLSLRWPDWESPRGIDTASLLSRIVEGWRGDDGQLRAGR